jgi:hypothetical protein
LCPGITEKLKAGEPGLVDANRGGMEWKHPYCNTLRSDVEKVLAPYVDNKRKELAKESDALISEKTKKILGNLCNLLNRFARDEIELLKNLEFNPQNMQEIMVKPDFANLEAGVPRSFSIYVPEPLWPLLDSGENIAIWSTNPNIQVLCSALKTSSLSSHPKYAGLLYGHFEVIGEGNDEDGKVVCKLGEYSAFTNVKVATPKKLPRKKRKLGWKWGGLFAGIEPNETPKPLQRVKYDSETCEIHIFVNFPSVRLYIGPKFEGIDTEQGRIMLAELLSEAFCRYIAMERR